MYQRERRSLFSLISLVAILVLAGSVQQVLSQEKYPTRGIEIICPFSAGGGVDLGSRIMAFGLSNKWGVPVNVIGKPGGNTVPACLEVYQASPDGYTILADCLPTSSLLPAIVRDLPFKIMDRTFIAYFGDTSCAIFVSKASPLKSLKEVEIEAKKNPGSLTWTSLGGVATIDLALRQFFKVIGVDLSKTKAVMCQGATQAASLTAGGHVILGAGGPSTAMPVIQMGSVKPLAVTSKTRWSELPDVPTTAELGYPSVNTVMWYGFSGPPKMPSYIVEKWENTLQEILKDPETISKLKKIGTTAFYRNAHETRELVIKETEEMRELMGPK